MLLRQLTYTAASKPCRVAGHLGFASIKAAVCSGNTAHNATGNSPTTSSSNTSSSPADSLGVSIPPSSVVEIAVAAALSPRATKAQTQALVGVFGGGGLVASDGGIGSHSGGARPACARRVTWGSVAEGERASKVCWAVAINRHAPPVPGAEYSCWWERPVHWQFYKHHLHDAVTSQVHHRLLSPCCRYHHASCLQLFPALLRVQHQHLAAIVIEQHQLPAYCTCHTTTRRAAAGAVSL